ncbi:Rxt3-domain-containing protein [Hypoxylon sp. NC1633]|nr:Rxt3-domain-containing protein [Hypoxylon sp. NC1633]
MDSRQPPPQLPFARNAASPVYGRPPFPPASNSNPIITTTSSPFHPSNPTSAGPAVYGEHQRLPSDTAPFYPQSRPPPYAPEPTSHGHSRHQSSSSVNAPLPRNMPPPSPPQQPPPVPHPSHQMGHYGGPPAPRAPPMNLGSSSAFPSARELPALNSIPRTGSTGGSMSISSMLGGPPPAPREPTPGHPTSFPPPATTAAVSGSAYASSMHASPRIQNVNEYPPYNRRPQTPDQGRPFDARDHRGSTAGSPPQGMYGTPELSRYNTPQAYPPRGPQMPPAEERREQVMTSASAPPRPSSQPRFSHGIAPRSMDMGRGPPPGDPMYGRREEARPPGPAELGRQARALPYEEQRRFASEREIREQMNRDAEFRERERRERERMHYEEQRPFVAERERMEREREREREMEREREREREREDMRERARRERTTSDPSRPHGQHPPELPPQVITRQPPYGRPDPRDPAAWQRPGYDQPPPPRDMYGQPYSGPRPGEFPSTTTAPYGAHPAYGPPPPHDRFVASGPIPVSQPGPAPTHPFESPDRHRFVQAHPQQQPPPPGAHRGRAAEEGPPPPSVAYNGGPGSAPFEVGRLHTMPDGAAAAGHQRGFLGIQEINRKGRVSPLPQAVQGAQPQLQGPAGEPGIKSEFGRMFSGIGSGVRGIGVSSPVPAGMQPQFPSAGPVRHDETHPGHELLADIPAKTGARGKRRKAKDDDGKGDDDSTGRITPVARAKRPKTNAHHHHHQAAATSSSKPAAFLDFPKPKQRISSQAVLDSVAGRPRKHLGDVLYQVTLKPTKLDSSHSKFGYSSNPRPLPMDVIKDNENSTLTVKIPRVHLSPSSREEITTRRAVWGTDVYTDDSDVVAACIHAGWIRGEWSEDVDVDLLELYNPPTSKKQRAVSGEQHLEVLTSPPASGPVHVPADRDLHVTLLILPALEKYSSSTRYGMQSREFGGTYNGRKSIHDGISYMITSVRWVDGAAPQSRLRGKARRERIRKAMSEVNRSHVVDIGEKEIMSKMEAARDNSVGKEKKNVGGLADGSNGGGDKENCPATDSHDAIHPPDHESFDANANTDAGVGVREKSGSTESQGMKAVDVNSREEDTEKNVAVEAAVTTA